MEMGLTGALNLIVCFAVAELSADDVNDVSDIVGGMFFPLAPNSMFLLAIICSKCRHRTTGTDECARRSSGISVMALLADVLAS